MPALFVAAARGGYREMRGPLKVCVVKDLKVMIFVVFKVFKESSKTSCCLVLIETDRWVPGL